MRSVVRNPNLPKGFFFKVRKECNEYYGCDCPDCRKSNDGYGGYTMEVELFSLDYQDAKVPIGGITLQKNGKTKKGTQIWETHSHLSSNYWNKKLGAKMYVRAIKWCLDRGYKVQSSDSTSELAQRVWNGKTIRKYVRIIKRKHANGGYSSIWHAYAKQGTR